MKLYVAAATVQKTLDCGIVDLKTRLSPEIALSQAEAIGIAVEKQLHLFPGYSISGATAIEITMEMVEDAESESDE